MNHYLVALFNEADEKLIHPKTKIK